MKRASPGIFFFLILASALGDSRTARAAESYDTCTGFITSVPTVITVHGTWCLKNDLSTAIASGNAIDIQTDNVTIDCNGFKLGGLAAGLATSTVGISADGKLNLVVRHCNIRGFGTGIGFFNGGSNVTQGQIIEDNRFDGITYRAMVVSGYGAVVQRNQILNTGGSTSSGGSAFGIVAAGTNDIVDNTLSGIAATSGSNGNVAAILDTNSFGGSIRGNRVRGLAPDGTGATTGILFISLSGRVSLRDNDLVGNSSANSVGVNCTTSDQHAMKNVISGFATGLKFCSDDGNVIAP